MLITLHLQKELTQMLTAGHYETFTWVILRAPGDLCEMAGFFSPKQGKFIRALNCRSIVPSLLKNFSRSLQN